MRTISWADGVLDYRLERSERRTVGITVFPDGTVRVRAPHAMSEARVRAVLTERARWIMRTRERLAAPRSTDAAPPHRMIAPRCGWALVLGERVPIREEHATGSGTLLDERTPTGTAAGTAAGTAGPRRRGASCRLDSTSRSLICTPAAGERAFHAWLADFARNHIAGRLEQLIAADSRLAELCLHTAAQGRAKGGRRWHPSPQRHPQVTEAPAGIAFRVRRMRRRWGSCSAGGALLFNTFLVCTPPECVDYVIVHELCHLRHMNHSRAFYGLLEELRPAWRSERARLREFEALVLPE